MGSEAGQDCERPTHRIWIDAFLLSATQVTNTEYDSFLCATASVPPPFWRDPNFNHPQQPVAGVSWYEATRYCDWLSAQTGRHCRLPTEAEWERAARGGVEHKRFPWGDDPPQSLPDYATRWQTGPNRSRATLPMHSVCTTSATMSTSGAVIGTIRISMPTPPSVIRAGRRQASAKPPAADHGATKSRSLAVPPVPASLQNSSTPTTASAWLVTCRRSTPTVAPESRRCREASHCRI
jgi:hypothetical protein